MTVGFVENLNVEMGTSVSPPALATGAHSRASMTIYTRELARAAGYPGIRALALSR